MISFMPNSKNIFFSFSCCFYIAISNTGFVSFSKRSMFVSLAGMLLLLHIQKHLHCYFACRKRL
ncbi:NADH-quinone oxidoreductase subunit A [Prevotella pallens ATCC 700821]|uniref:NADH-quinone oxidoreductase subunit A n=1 Tax=Prevotella pallens ATCC 700821 TaxID=997353 RepID=F9DET4_9BACT|nr:NADH-quinone oxidoreductase subunit A [Prevotella pallens ATCC 700821]